LWVAEADDGQIAGYVLAVLKEDEQDNIHGHISSLAVSTTHRKQRLATRLMSRAHLEMASISHAAYATLRVRISNQPALRLYTESFGYVVVDIKHRYYEDGEDAFVMQCALPVVGSEGFALMSQLDATDNPKPSTAVVTESTDQSSIIASLAPLRVSS